MDIMHVPKEIISIGLTLTTISFPGFVFFIIKYLSGVHKEYYQPRDQLYFSEISFFLFVLSLLIGIAIHLIEFYQYILS